MSGQSLGRKSLPVQLAERLEKDIHEGVWTDTLPGYRTLSAHYQVSEGTSKRAIQLLEQQGVIGPPEQGKNRKISRKARSSVEKMRLLIITDATFPLDKFDEKLLNDISVFWLHRGKSSADVDRVSGDLARYQHPAKLLSQWVHQHSATHLLFYGPPAPWIKAVIELGLPCYYLGGELGYAEFKNRVFPGSSQSWDLTLRDLLQRLRGMGHKHLLIPFDYGKRGFQKSVQATLYEIYQDRLSRAACEASVPVFQDFSPDSWQRNWEKEFMLRRPTCVVASNSFTVLSLYVFCARNNIKLGKDLSLICMQSDDILDWHDPRPTYLEYPYAKSLQDFKSWVRRGFPQRAHTYVKMVWNEGDTLTSI
ncbi:hypothetical protein NT6N_20870 [Oceaniferula spumae]|uniref:HTH gntR-type domain-containing protein n=1 Tax=Oceaniferula spumae TaxID=2979115 RepID=A0AAT9FM60_9BACT